jgi:fructose-bisphosphate aldolase, class I
MNLDGLNQVARAMVAPGKGILAADESHPTIKKRFEPIGVENTEEHRRSYREMLFTAPGIEDWIGGVILFDETLRQHDADGVPFPRLLADRGIVPGIKVDAGAKPLAGFPGETVTEGLDGLRQRMKDYRELGAAFAKWRAVIAIGDGLPSAFCIEANAHALARYAALCQEADIVPIVEPEVLMDGDHDLARCEAVTGAVLQEVFGALARHRVALEGIVLKPNMVVAGQDCPQRASVEEAAAATVRCLRRFVPSAVPGIAFLSGGQSEEEATAHLNAMNAMGAQPWELSFSYGRALQASALQAWAGDPSLRAAGAKAFAHRARMNHLARSGDYRPELESGAR